MNKRKYILSFLAISSLLFLVMACSSKPEKAKEPAWVVYPKEVYPSSDFLSYVGSGDSKNQAEINALNGLSSIFEQSVESSTTATTRMNQAKKGGIVATNIDKNIDSEILKKVNVENLTGVEIKDFYCNPITFEWYAIAVLNKKQATLLYKDMLIKNAEVINEITSGIKSNDYSLEAYTSYDFAQEIARENKQHLDRLYVIDYNVAEIHKNYAIPESKFIEKKREIANHIPLYINIKGDNDGIYEAAFLDALKAYDLSGTKDSSARYSINGEVSFRREDTSDGKTTKCYYELKTTVFDNLTNKQLFPINIRGRQSHVTFDKAIERAQKDLIKKINKVFSENFDNYLTSVSK